MHGEGVGSHHEKAHPRREKFGENVSEIVVQVFVREAGGRMTRIGALRRS